MTWMLVLSIVATYRLTRLVIDDTITQSLRMWLGGVTVEERDFHGAVVEVTEIKRPRIAYLLSCYWCLSIWIGAVCAWAAVTWPDAWWLYAAFVALTASALSGWLGFAEERLSPEVEQ